MYAWILQEMGRRPRLFVGAYLAVGLAVSAGLLWGFMELAEEVFEGETRSFDRAVLLWIHNNFPEWLTGPMRLITGLGYYWVVGIALVVSAALLYLRGFRLSAALLTVSTFGSAALTTVLKAVYQRTRPELFDTGYEASFFSFPSGHATVAVGFYGTLAVLVALQLSGWRRWVVAGSGVALVALIGFSRLYLGVHYPTDVVAGYLAAALWVSLVASTLLLVRWVYTGSLRRRKQNE